MPRSRAGRLAAFFLGLGLLLLGLQRLVEGRFPLAAGGLQPWIVFSALAFLVFVLVLGVRWVRQRLMWTLRNRLIVTYVFIGVIPVLLLLTIGGLSGYLLGGQFATYIATSDLRAELNGLAAMNTRIGIDLASHLPEQGRISERMLRGAAGRRPAYYPFRETTVWYRGAAVTSGDAPPTPPPREKYGETRSFVVEEGRILLRVADTIDLGQEELTVISSVPLGPELLERVAAELGTLTLSILNGAATEPVRAGTLPPRANWFDRQITGPVGIPTSAWSTGAEENRRVLLIVNTRPSLLKARLFRVVGGSLNFGLYTLAAVAIVFGLVELLALLVGVRLTRTMVRSITGLYNATLHVESGNLSHRIPVERNDQLAALERSFNSMTGSLESLIAEQREKQRLDDDLAIAQEVQSQLFPREHAELDWLELYGVCRPARTVSGDYYDFLPLGPGRLLFALGDVSGKGISAALLMATIHSAVRAYSLQEAPAHALAAAPSGASQVQTRDTVWAGNGEISPAHLLTMMNRHLYRSTTPEKYATLFLGIYNRDQRTLSYANAGHLPPLLLSRDNSIRRLTSGGMVLGLFQDILIEQAEITLHPDDLVVAYSDGITEPENEFGEFGEARLIQLVRENSHLPLQRISEEITQAVRDWIGAAEQPDDLTLLLARPR